jgi:hypothetical protein
MWVGEWNEASVARALPRRGVSERGVQQFPVSILDWKGVDVVQLHGVVGILRPNSSLYLETGSATTPQCHVLSG